MLWPTVCSDTGSTSCVVLLSGVSWVNLVGSNATGVSVTVVHCQLWNSQVLSLAEDGCLLVKLSESIFKGNAYFLTLPFWNENSNSVLAMWQYFYDVSSAFPLLSVSLYDYVGT